MWRLAAVLCLLLPIACTDPATQVLVRVDIDGATMQSRSTAVRVRVFDQDGMSTLQEERAIGEIALPFSVSLVPAGGDASRRFRVEIALVDAMSSERPPFGAGSCGQTQNLSDSCDLP